MTSGVCDLSLVICTRNRAPQLARTLERVARIRSRLSWELIIADNGSTDRTNAVVQEYAAARERAVRMIRIPGLGVSYARNAGWQSAKSYIIPSIGADCYPAESSAHP